MSAMKRVLVTGATGFLGTHLCERVIQEGYEVTALVRDHAYRSRFWDGKSSSLNIVAGEVEDFRLMERILNEYEIDTVFHLAAQTVVGIANRNPVSTFQSNIQGTISVLEAVRTHKARVHRVILASTDKAYGSLSEKAYNEDHPLQGRYPYDVSKSCVDLIAQSYFHTYGLKVAITRCGNFFGPGDIHTSRLIPGTILSFLKNERPLIRSHGKLIRDYLYIEDAVEAYMKLALNMPLYAGHAFNFSYGVTLSVLEVVQMIQKQMNRTLEARIQNEALHEIPVQTLDSSKARKLLNWEPQVPFEKALGQTIEWYRTHLEKFL